LFSSFEITSIRLYTPLRNPLRYAGYTVRVYNLFEPNTNWDQSLIGFDVNTCSIVITPFPQNCWMNEIWLAEVNRTTLLHNKVERKPILFQIIVFPCNMYLGTYIYLFSLWCMLKNIKCNGLNKFVVEGQHKYFLEPIFCLIYRQNTDDYVSANIWCWKG
jgi:hypothetical protein